MKERESAPTTSQLERRQLELQQREREILELGYLRRTNGQEAVRDAVRRLGELGSPAAVLTRAPRELGTNSQFDRILISEVVAAEVRPLAIWERDDDHAEPPGLSGFRIEYPLIEHEVVQGHGTQLAFVEAMGSRTPAPLTEAFGWASYVVSAIVVGNDVVGLLHADAASSGRIVDELDREIATHASTGLAAVLDRAVLRESLLRHRAELQSAVAWLSGRLRAANEVGPLNAAASGSEAIDDSLTPREREILALMARGQTNGQIATALAVREGTVKYHVKNVLRKLGARSRADAVARYVRAVGAAPR